MKKLLYIITLPDWGGAQRYIFDLAENLKNEFEITVASGEPSMAADGANLIEKCEKNGIKTHFFKNLVRPISPINDVLAVLKIAKYINCAKPDIIHLNSSKAGVVASLSAALAKHKPRVIYTVHGWVFFEPMHRLKSLLYIFLEKLASRWRHILITLGEKEKESAAKYNICPPEKIKIIRHAVKDLKFFDKELAREKLRLPQNKKIAGTVANFYMTKGLKYLIEAAAKSKDEDIIFALIGDGPLKEELGASIKETGFENKIILLGAIDEASRYLRAFDVFILPSVKEGMPYVILEAMHAKIPIIATAVGGIEEMLSNYENKIIIPPADSEALKQAILKMDVASDDAGEGAPQNFSEFITLTKNLYND